MKIHKHFSPTTPFSVAEDDEEMAKILCLKYPRACSSLETGAEFFSSMVQEVREYEAYKLIGFDTFESFCAAKLGKTLQEVEEIVQGVKLLGGNPTEKEAKKASRSARAAELVKAGTHTQQEAAEEMGITQPAVAKAIGNINKKQVTGKKVIKPPQPTIKLANPSLTARNIRAKMGDAYAAALAKELLVK